MSPGRMSNRLAPATAVFARNRTAHLVVDTGSFADAEAAVRRSLGRTELDEERRLGEERRPPRWRSVTNPLPALQRFIAVARVQGADFVTYRCLQEHLRISDVADVRDLIAQAGLSAHPPLVVCAP